MKVAYVCADFGIPIRGSKGASVHMREMAAALSRQGHDVRIYAARDGAGNELPAELQLIGANGLPRLLLGMTPEAAMRKYPRLGKELRETAYNLNLYRQLGRAFSTWRPDFVLERYSLFTVGGLAAAKRQGIPHLLEVNAPLQSERERTIGLSSRTVARLFDRQLFGRTDHTFMVSEALRRYVLDNGGRETHVSVLPNGVDIARFSPRGDSADVRRRYGLDADALVVGFAGSLKTWHGTEALLEAFVAVRQREPRARLLIVGTGPRHEAARELAASLNIDAATVFTGAVEHRNMPDLLAIMDVGVAPYLHVPDFYFSPLKLYEYMAAGLPVVASDAGSIASLVRPGETGLLCPPGDVSGLAEALLRLLRDAELRQRLSVAARAEAEAHSWDENARIVTERALAVRDGAGRPSQPAPLPGKQGAAA